MVAGNNNAFSFVRLKYGDNETDTVTGMLIYPDDFSFADAGVDAMTFGVATPTEIEIDSWRALERFGCVLLPANTAYDIASYIESQVGLYAYYWSSDAYNSRQASQMVYNLAAMFMRADRNDNRCKHFSVRLVQDY